MHVEISYYALHNSTTYARINFCSNRYSFPLVGIFPILSRNERRYERYKMNERCWGLCDQYANLSCAYYYFFYLIIFAYNLLCHGFQLALSQKRYWHMYHMVNRLLWQIITPFDLFCHCSPIHLKAKITLCQRMVFSKIIARHALYHRSGMKSRTNTKFSVRYNWKLKTYYFYEKNYLDRKSVV